MANAFTLKAELRNDIGKGASRRLRREDKLPAVLYGGEDTPQSLTLSHSEILKCLNDESFYSQIIDIEIDGEITETILRDMQRHPYKPSILHIDFQRIVRGQELTLNVPIHYLNADTAVGVKAGGILSQNIIDVEIVCRPRNIPEALEVDVANLDINDGIRLTDINLPEGVKIPVLEQLESEDDDTNITIVSIHPPKTEVVEEEASTEENSAEVPSEHGSSNSDKTS